MPDTSPPDPQIQAAIDEIATGVETKIQAAKAEAKAEADAAKKDEVLAALAGVKSRLGI